MKTEMYNPTTDAHYFASESQIPILERSGWVVGQSGAAAPAPARRAPAPAPDPEPTPPVAVDTPAADPNTTPAPTL